MKPIIVVNFKTYKQGVDVLRLAKKIEKVDKKIIIGVQASDIEEVAKNVKLNVFCQHVDWQKPGRGTGFILPEAVKVDGATGVFLNHSEHKLSFSVLKKTVKRCQSVGLKVLIFASGLQEARKIKKLKPDYLVVEPPELVGGKVSVSRAKPELISDVAKKLGCDFLIGAGIKSSEDVKIAIKLGASGVTVSSGVVKARNPGKILKEFLI